MRATRVLAGLALPLGLAVPVVAESSEMAQPAPEMLLAAYDGMGSGGGRPQVQTPKRPGGWQRSFGHGHRGPSFAGMVLMNRTKLGLTTQQVDSFRKLGKNS